MDSLSVGDVQVCNDKFTIQSSSYDGASVEHREHLIQGNQVYSSSQHAMNLLKTSPPLHVTISNHIPRNADGKDSDVHRHYGIECNMIAENVYQTREEIGASFERTYLYTGDDKIRNNENDIFKQGASNGHSYIYCNESSLIQESMSAKHGDCLGRYPFNSAGDARSVDNMVDLVQEAKGVSARCVNYESVVSDFLPETPQNKEQFYLLLSAGRGSHCDEAVPGKSYQCHQDAQEGNSIYTHQMMPSQHPHFSEMDFHRAEHFSGTQETGSILCLENSSRQQESSYCPSTNVVDISRRQNGEAAFESGSKVSTVTNESSVLVDGYSEQMENASAVEALMTLQGEVGAALGTDSDRIPVLKSNQAYEACAKLPGVSESHVGENSDQCYLSNSDSLPELGLQTVNAKSRKKKRGRKHTLKPKQENSSADVDNTSNKFTKISRKNERRFKDIDLVALRGVKKVDKINKKGKHKVSRTKLVNGEIKDICREMVFSSKEGKCNKKTEEPQAESSLIDNHNPLSEDDAAWAQSVESPPPMPVDKKRKFKCKLCKMTFKFRKDLNKHTKTHAATKKFACSVCSSGFINRTLLKKHLLTHSDIKFFTCSECSVTCHSLVELKSHQKIHSRAEVFSCSKCSFTAKRQKHLTKHMLVHSAAKVYHCQFCKFSSKRKYSLQRHVKTAHSSAQTHECSVCNFNTNAVDSFKVHVAMHASTRTTSCIICGTVIKKRQNLIEHLLSHSNDEDTTCKECDETCTTSHEYILHLLNHKDISSTSHEGNSQDLAFDLNTATLNGSVDSTSGMSGLQTRKNKVIMDTPTMEGRLAQMATVASRLADMTKVVTLLNEKSKVVFQLAEISTLATELAVISGQVLQSYKNTYGVAADVSASKVKSPSTSNDATDESSIEGDGDDDDVDEVSQEFGTLTTKTKDDSQEHAFSSTEADMQIQVDFNGKPVSCVQKDESFRPESSTKSKGTKLLKCFRCSMTFTDSRSLKRHLLAHDNVRPYYCENCGRSFRRNEHLKKHMVTHSDERPFTCKDCPYAAKTEHRLKIHALCHSQTKAYACHHCTYTARTNYELNHHMKRHEPRSCSQCPFVCYSRAELKKHVFTHSSFDCNECEFTTSDRAEYTKHTKKHTLVQHLCCELCGYSCDTMKKFKYHKLRHDNKTPYQCQDCDYRCSSRASFDCHRLKHAGLKPYLCSSCGASFRKTSHLNQHLLIHKDEKAFKCSECNYSCRTKHNLKEHEMTHSGEKPFSCKYCSFSCRRNKALQLHMLKHESSGLMIPPLQMPTIVAYWSGNVVE